MMTNEELIKDALDSYDCAMEILRQRNPAAADVLLGSFMTMVDGKPIHWTTLAKKALSKERQC